MTVAQTHAPARGRARSLPAFDPAPRLNWAALGVCAAIFAQVFAGVWFAATLSARVHAIEEQMPPQGAIQRLDERTLQMQHVLERLEARP